MKERDADANSLRLLTPEVQRAAAEAETYGTRLQLPRASPHRLLRLARTLDADLAARSGTLVADLVELRAILDTLDAVWASTVLYQLLFSTLRDPEQFDHQILTLATLRVLRMWKNSMDLEPEGPTGDLVLHAPPVEVLVEVKAPRALTNPAAETAIDAHALVASALKSSKAQRAKRPSALLVHAGFRVRASALEALANAWSASLTHDPQRGAIAAGIAITVGRHADEIPVHVRQRTQEEQRRVGVHERFASVIEPNVLTLGIRIHIGRNNTYSGPAPVIGLDHQAMGIRLPPKPSAP